MSKYLNPANYWRYALALANRYALGHIETWVAPKSDQPLRHPPIFFVGAPRSGSTLAVQVITEALDVGYISNSHCRWFGAPALVERLIHPIRERPPSDFRSRQGLTEGSHAPAECGQWWYRFFRREPAYVTLDDTEPKNMRAFRRSLLALTEAFDKSVVFKNLYASLRIQAIAHYIPEALFVVTHREETDNAHSLLETRMKVFGKYDKWWSMEPPDIDGLRMLPVHEQVVEQIRHIHTCINDDLRRAHVPEERVFHLQYEKFCKNTHATLDALSRFLEANHSRVTRVGNPPRQFPRRSDIRIDEDLYKQVERYVGRN